MNYLRKSDSMYGMTHRKRRQLEAAGIGIFNLYEITKKGKDVTGEDYLKAAGKVAAQISMILAVDVAVAKLVAKGILQKATWTLVGVQAVYLGGAAVSELIDPDEGLQNYNQFIDVAISSPSVATQVTVQSGLDVLDKKYPGALPTINYILNQLEYGIS